QLHRGFKPHPWRVECKVLGFKSPLRNVITNYELFKIHPKFIEIINKRWELNLYFVADSTKN
ncbi:MAG: hypothetical protein AAFY21_19725, partial [Cyanobacteria bacterium J06641_2]